MADEFSEGQTLDQSSVVPSITIEDLKIDRTKLTIFGQGNVTRVNNKAELDMYLGRVLTQVNRLFNDRELAERFVADAEQGLVTLNAQENPDDESLAARDSLQVLKDFGIYARGGDKASALLALERASRENTQDAIVRAGGMDRVHFRDADRADIAYSITELSKIKYASTHEGRMYQSSEQKANIQEAIARGKSLRVS